MGGILGILVASVAAYLFFADERPALGIVASIVATTCLLSWLQMRFFACCLARQSLYFQAVNRGDFEDGSPEAQRYRSEMSIAAGVFLPFLANYSISERDARDVPDWITAVNMIATLAGVALLIGGVVETCL